MTIIDFEQFSRQLPQDWQSQSVGCIGETKIKVLRMNGAELEEEQHPYAEALVVVNGFLNLVVNEEDVPLQDGQMYIVPPHTLHSVKPGSSGTLLIISPF